MTGQQVAKKQLCLDSGLLGHRQVRCQWRLRCSAQAGAARTGVECLVSEKVTVQTEQVVAFLTLVHLKTGNGNRITTNIPPPPHITPPHTHLHNTYCTLQHTHLHNTHHIPTTHTHTLHPTQHTFTTHTIPLQHTPYPQNTHHIPTTHTHTHI